MTREEAMAKINMLRYEYNDRYIDYCGVNEAVNMAIEALNAEPVRRGRWEATVGGVYCSECADAWSDEVESMIQSFNYCPNCGARMEEQE